MSAAPKTAANPIPSGSSYQSLHPLALVGLGLGILSLVVFVTEAAWMIIFLAIPGLIVSFIALYRIQRSEGTVAGGGLATAGAILCLVSAVGWSTQYAVTYWIIKSESVAFLEGFFAKMAKDPEGKEAFLDTVVPQYRNVNIPLDRPEAAGRLAAHFRNPSNGTSLYDDFRNDKLWPQILRYGDRVEWKPLGISEWRYDKESYTVIHRYEMRTPAYIGEVLLITVSEMAETPEGSRRGWRVREGGPNGSRFATVPANTPYGEALEDARIKAEQDLMMWFQQIAAGSRPGSLKPLMGAGEQREMTAISLGCLPLPALALSGNDPWLVYAPFFLTSTLGEKLLQFAIFYGKIRADEPVGLSMFRPSRIQLARDQLRGEEWTLDYRCFADNRLHDIDFELTLHGNPSNPTAGWRINHVKIVGIRKHQEPGGQQPQQPGFPK